MSRTRFILAVGLSLGLLVPVPSALLAQSASTGTIAGTVTDPSGAAIAAATVTLTDKSTGVPRAVSTNENGRYLLVDVPPGTYNLAVTKDGFRTSKLTDQTVTVGSALTLN